MWYKFDDDRVVPVTEKEVYEDNFGGDFSMVSGLMDRQTRFHKSFTNAYMLVYVREADRDVILGEVTEKDIPSHLSLNIERERLEAERIAKERAERHLFINVSVLQESDIKDYQGFDLWNWDAKDLHPEMNFKIRKDETVADLKVVSTYYICIIYNLIRRK
jgi:ubiquitin carboxyl-terminal hydrolase 7